MMQLKRKNKTCRGLHERKKNKHIRQMRVGQHRQRDWFYSAIGFCQERLRKKANQKFKTRNWNDAVRMWK